MDRAALARPHLYIAVDAAPTGGEVEGVLTEGGHTFVGTFEPPLGSPGPWLLISESTQRAGHMQKAYRFVAGR